MELEGEQTVFKTCPCCEGSYEDCPTCGETELDWKIDEIRFYLMRELYIRDRQENPWKYYTPTVTT